MINIFTNIPEIPLQEVILQSSCHRLSPLDIKSLDTVNNNEKKSVSKTLQILSGGLVA